MMIRCRQQGATSVSCISLGLCSVIVTVLLSCIFEKEAGTVEDTDTGLVTAYLPDKALAAGALVKFIPADRTQNISLTKMNRMSAGEVVADENGQFEVPPLPDSLYNVYIELDSVKAMQSAVFISPNSHSVHDDTLETTGSFRGRVELEPNDMHNIRSVYVQVLGSDVAFVNADKDGFFEFKDLAAGAYRLRFETSLDDYSVTFEGIEVESGKDTERAEPFRIIYTGISVAQGLSASFDTTSGTVTLIWASTEYADFLDYVIYRDSSPVTDYSRDVYATSLDTIYEDLIFDPGEPSRVDPKSMEFAYRVAVRNNSMEIGRTYGAVKISAVPLMALVPEMRLTVLEDSISKDDAVRIRGQVGMGARKLKALRWHKNEVGNVIDSLIPENAVANFLDTLTTRFTEVDTSWIYLESEDMGGDRYLDSIYVAVLSYPPVITISDTIKTASVNDTIHFNPEVSDNGSIVEYAWKFGEGDWVETNTADTFAIAPSTAVSKIQYFLRVTDDDGQTATFVWDVSVGDLAPIVSAGGDKNVGIGSSIHLEPEATDDGTRLFYEWAFGDSNWISVSGDGDTVVQAPMEPGKYSYKLRVTDDDGRMRTVSMVVTVARFPVHTVFDSVFGATTVIAADLDGDGDLDVLSASTADSIIRWHENDGTASFNSNNKINTVTGVVYSDLEDMDGDGDMDIISAKNGKTIQWHENDGTASFVKHDIANSPTYLRLMSIIAADIDGDNDMDIVSADSLLYGFENDGSNSYIGHELIDSTVEANAIFAADMDGDGDVDIVAGSRDYRNSFSGINWYENDSSALFSKHTVEGVPGTITSVVAADVNGDGAMDIVSASYRENSIRWYENDGASSFTEHTIYGSAEEPVSVFAVDLDNDGDTDVLSASQADNTIRWYENDGTSSFTVHILFEGALGASSVFAADIDGDGDMDVLSASRDDGIIRWYENLLE